MAEVLSLLKGASPGKSPGAAVELRSASSTGSDTGRRVGFQPPGGSVVVAREYSANTPGRAAGVAVDAVSVAVDAGGGEAQQLNVAVPKKNE